MLDQRIAAVWDRALAGSESLREAVARAFQLSEWGGGGAGRPLLAGVSHEPWCWERRSHQQSRSATTEPYHDDDAPLPLATRDGHDTRHLAVLLYHRNAAIDAVAPHPLAFRGCTTPEPFTNFCNQRPIAPTTPRHASPHPVMVRFGAWPR